MQIDFIPRNSDRGPLADVEVAFESGDAAGFKLVGIALWRKRSGDGYSVTFPSRQYKDKDTQETKYFEFWRASLHPKKEKELKEQIIRAFEDKDFEE